MKNQSFHQRKIRIQESTKLNFDQLKAKTINALNKLGQQKFSAEPGGYALENWTKGVNVLLDEFEKDAGAGKLSPEYLARRRELTEQLSTPVNVSTLDESMAETRKSVSNIETKIETERARLHSGISDLKTEHANCSDDLQRERSRVAAVAAAPTNDSFISRLLGRKPAVKVVENRIKDLEARLSDLSDQLLERQKQLKAVDLRSPGSPFAEDWGQLEAMQTRLNGLDQERLDRTQLVKERVEMTASIAEAISRIQ